MKLKIIGYPSIFCLLFFLPFTSQGQFEIGFFMGGNINNIHLSERAPFSAHSATNLMIGISPRFRFNEKFRLLSDISYTRKGFETRNRNSRPNDVGIDHRTSYFEFSEQIEYSFTKHIAISAGGFVAKNLKQEINFDDNWDDDALELFPDWDLGLSVGIRSYIKNFTIFLVYDHSLNDVSDVMYTNSNGDPVGSLELKNRTIELGLGYIWNLGRKELAKI